MGEERLELIAIGVAREPWLIIMDEPTNHLDLVTIECLEAALDDCPAGLLLVSPDRMTLGWVINATTRNRPPQSHWRGSVK